MASFITQLAFNESGRADFILAEPGEAEQVADNDRDNFLRARMISVPGYNYRE